MNLLWVVQRSGGGHQVSLRVPHTSSQCIAAERCSISQAGRLGAVYKVPLRLRNLVAIKLDMLWFKVRNSGLVHATVTSHCVYVCVYYSVGLLHSAVSVPSWPSADEEFVYYFGVQWRFKDSKHFICQMSYLQGSEIQNTMWVLKICKYNFLKQ